MAELHIRYFGGVSLVGRDLNVQSFATVRAAKLLVLLTLSRSGRMQRTQLADQLWPEDPFESTRIRLRQEIHRLKRALGDSSELIGSSSDEVWIDNQTVLSDYKALENFGRGQGQSQYEYCFEGAFLPGWDDPWAVAERSRAQQLQVTTAISLANQFLDAGNPSRALEFVLKLIPQFPTHEELRMIAVSAHSKLGSLASAVAEYQDLRRQTREHLGVEPASYKEDYVADITAAAGSPKVSDWSSMVPSPIDPIFGREDLVEQVMSRLEHPATRLVTLVGPGGVGKTRIAVEIAQRLVQTSSVRVAFVSLADVQDPAQWSRTVLTQLREDPPSESDPLKYLSALLGHKPSVLVLDNLETVLPVALETIQRLVADTAELKVLITSVVPSRADKEILVSVGPLDPATAGCELLSSVLQTIRPQMLSMPGTLRDLLEVATRLDGYPLALKLASARLRLLSPQALLKQLDSSLSGGGRSDLPNRHQSLDTALSSSFASLSENQLDAMRRIAAYPGGISMELAAIEFDGESYLDTIESLLDLALLTVDDQSDSIRVRMLAPIHQYVKSSLDESTRLRLEENAARSVFSYLAPFELAPWLPLRTQLLAVYDSETDNLAFAWKWARQNEPLLAYGNLARFVRYEASRGRAVQLLGQVSSMQCAWSSQPQELVAELELAFAFLTNACHQDSLALEPLQRAKAAAKDLDNGLLNARIALADALCAFRINFSEVKEKADLALNLAELVKDPYCIVRAHKVLGNVADFLAQPKLAIEHISKAYQGLLESGSALEAATTGVYLANYFCHFGRVEEGDAIIMRSRPIVLGSRDPGAMAYFNEVMGRIALFRENPVEAEGLFRESLRIWHAIGSDFQEADQSHSLTLSLIRQGRWADARVPLVSAGELWYRDQNKGGLCCSLVLVSAVLRSQGEIEAAKDVLAFALEFEKTFDLVLVKSELDLRADLISELSGVGRNTVPLTLDGGLSLFDQIR